MARVAADRLILCKNGEDARSGEIELYMPELCVDKWILCQSLVEEMLSFLTGDKWKICFRERELTEIEKKAKKKVGKSNREEYDVEFRINSSYPSRRENSNFIANFLYWRWF